MNDAIVTARMPKAKKDAGNRVLAQIGSNASQLINSAYDFLIQHGESPFAVPKEEEGVSAERLAEALARVEGMCLPASNRFASMSDDEIRRERLARQGLRAR